MVSRVFSFLACIFVYLANGQLNVEENEVKVTENKTANTVLKSPRPNIKGILFDVPWSAKRENLSLPKQRTDSYVNIKMDEKVSIISTRNKAKSGSGWPNFSEIMRSRKKWKKHICKNDRNVAKTKNVQRLKHCNVESTSRDNVYNITKVLESDDILNFVKQTKINKKSDKENIYEYKDVSSINRPNFQYHRVTSSPHDQHKNNAILALSVVRRNNVITSSTPVAVSKSSAEEGRKWSRELQAQLKSIPVAKSRLRHHWHHGHHLHSAKIDINGLHH